MSLGLVGTYPGGKAVFTDLAFVVLVPSLRLPCLFSRSALLASAHLPEPHPLEGYLIE